MSSRLIGRLILTAVAIFGLVFPTAVGYAANPDSVRNALSDARVAVPAQHTITLDMSATTSLSAGETISITLHAAFSVPTFTAVDVSFNDGTARTVLNSCVAGANNLELSVSGQTVALTACSGFVPSANGALVAIVLGVGATQAVNPATSGLYLITVAGSYGDDPRSFILTIIEGVTFSFTIPFPTGNVRFTGFAFPGALVTILDSGMVVGNAVANSASFFDKTVTGLTPGIHTFGIYGQSLDGRRTLVLSFDVNVISGTTITVGGILLPPILTIPAQEKRPKTFVQSGLARHHSIVTTFTAGPTNRSDQVSTNANGEWTVNVPQVLRLGAHSMSALVNDGNGNQSVLTNPSVAEILLSADLNVDNLVSLTDFSMLMFSYGLANPPNVAADINDSGGQVDLVDFSVMMFYWTGG